MFPFFSYDGDFKKKPTNKLRICYRQIIHVGEKKLLETTGKNKKAAQEKKYNLIFDPEVNAMYIVTIMQTLVTDFNFQFNLHTKYGKLHRDYRKNENEKDRYKT